MFTFNLFTIAVGVIIGLVQLILCLRERKRWLKWLPCGVLVGFELICWVMYGLARTGILEEIPAIKVGFYGVIFGMMGFYWIAGVVLAWMVYGIVRLVQKRKKG